MQRRDIAARRGSKRQTRLVARNIGATFVDPNSWIRDEDFGRDGFHLNRNGARQFATSTAEFVE